MPNIYTATLHLCLIPILRQLRYSSRKSLWNYQRFALQISQLNFSLAFPLDFRYLSNDDHSNVVELQYRCWASLRGCTNEFQPTRKSRRKGSYPNQVEPRCLQLGWTRRESSWHSHRKVLVWFSWYFMQDRLELSVEQHRTNLCTRWRAPNYRLAINKSNHHSDLDGALDTILQGGRIQVRGLQCLNDCTHRTDELNGERLPRPNGRSAHWIC